MMRLPYSVAAWRVPFALAVIVFAFGAYAQEPAGALAGGTPADKGAFEKVCGACHSPAMVDSFRSEPDWRDTVANMVELGARGTNEQMDGVMRYLLRVWTRININVATARQISQTIGVSDPVAQKIVDTRSHGNLRNCEDLIKATGLPALRESCKDRIVFE
jgi:helix-hairpin-helix protein